MNCYRLKIFASLKSTSADFRNAIGNDKSFILSSSRIAPQHLSLVPIQYAVQEYIVAAFSQHYVGKSSTLRERTCTYFRHVCMDSHNQKIATVLKRTLSDFCNTCRNFNSSNIFTILKCSFTYFRYAVRNENYARRIRGTFCDYAIFNGKQSRKPFKKTSLPVGTLDFRYQRVCQTTIFQRNMTPFLRCAAVTDCR